MSRRRPGCPGTDALTRTAGLAAVCCLAVGAGLGLGAGPGAGPAYGEEPAAVREAFRFTDPEVVESSGLTDRDGLFTTVNDSGDAARVFTVDPATGDTVGVTTFADEVVDVEALAPVADGEGGFEDRAVWVGDVGANVAPREAITVHRVPVGRGERTVDAPAYDLVYPDGVSRDAESLLADPATGRLVVITKEPFGGRVYLAPARLDAEAPNRLEEVGDRRVQQVATDAAFFGDGEHLVVRSYERAVVYSWPELETVGTLDLPAQEQGEGISVSETGRVHLSSEGVEAPVLFVALPEALRDVVTPTDRSAPAPGPPSASPTGPTIVEEPEGFDPEDYAGPDGTSGSAFGPGRGNWLVGGLLGLGVVVVLVRALRPR